MSNGKVQSKTNQQDKIQSHEPEPRVGRIQMGIQRTLNTAQYESVVIYYNIDEEIKWRTPEERHKKVRNWETVLVEEFKGAHDRILDELGLSHKKAYIKNHSPKMSTNELDSLDNLDPIE